MKRALLALVLVGTLSGLAYAYTFNGAKWALRRGESVPYVVNSRLSADLPDNECLGAIQEGYDVWTALPCSYMAWDYRGRTENRAWGAGDGENVTSWREESWDDSPAALAITSSIWGGGGLTDTDIKFNGFHHQWAAFDRGGPGGFDGRTDIASVSAHEVGHALGLGHTDVPGSTMWPSTGPGDVTGRTLGQDDIQGACEIYPSGGEIPEPDPEAPPPPGNLGFGEDCSMGRCDVGLFCISDGRESYCTQECVPGGDSCPDDYYCARLSEGGGACAKGEDPAQDLGSFGEPCGADQGCQAGLVCLNDDGNFYCTGPCLNEMCPENYFCAELQTGGDVCARGDGAGGGELPGLGDPCTDRGLCQRGMFCLNDDGNVDEATGEAVPYCTGPCDGGQVECEAGYRCVDVAPSGTACRKIPSAGQRDIGQDCWVNPEAPWQIPECGDQLICTGWTRNSETGLIEEKGYCTKDCNAESCCPEGWGCAALTPLFGQCAEGLSDSRGLECDGERPDESGRLPDDPGGDTPDGGVGGGDGGDTPKQAGDGGGDGCAVAPAGRAAPWALGFLLLGLRRRRRRE